jgi:ABC-type branched-subunit amino acid transport system substrate-binding protein
MDRLGLVSPAETIEPMNRMTVPEPGLARIRRLGTGAPQDRTPWAAHLAKAIGAGGRPLRDRRAKRMAPIWRTKRSGVVTGTVGLMLAAALALSACGSSSSSSSGADTGSGRLTFPVFNPFSGPDASFGPEQLAGCIPAAAAIQAAGGILKHADAACKVSDSRGDPADAVPAAQQLIASTSGLMGILGPSSDEASATAPLFNRSSVPMFGDTGQAVFNRSSFQYFYRITAPDDAVGYAMALYAHNKGYKRAAAVFGSDISSQGTAPTVVAGFKKLGGSVVVNQKLPLDQSSYRTEIEQVVAARPDVIFTEADPQTSATYLAEMKQLYRLIPIVGTNGTNQPPWFKAVGGAIGKGSLAQLYAGAQPYAPTTGASYNAWLKDIHAVQAKVPQPAKQWFGDSYAMAAWDSVNLMALAAVEAKSTKPAVFRPFIAKVASPSPGAVKVHSFAEGKKAILAGKKIQYIGAVGAITFDRFNNSPGAFEIVKSDGTTPIVTYTASQVDAAK